MQMIQKVTADTVRRRVSQSIDGTDLDILSCNYTGEDVMCLLVAREAPTPVPDEGERVVVVRVVDRGEVWVGVTDATQTYIEPVEGYIERPSLESALDEAAYLFEGGVEG